MLNTLKIVNEFENLNDVNNKDIAVKNIFKEYYTFACKINSECNFGCKCPLYNCSCAFECLNL